MHSPCVDVAYGEEDVQNERRRAIYSRPMRLFFLVWQAVAFVFSASYYPFLGDLREVEKELRSITLAEEKENHEKQAWCIPSPRTDPAENTLFITKATETHSR